VCGYDVESKVQLSQWENCHHGQKSMSEAIRCENVTFVWENRHSSWECSTLSVSGQFYILAVRAREESWGVETRGGCCTMITYPLTCCSSSEMTFVRQSPSPPEVEIHSERSPGSEKI
jgi:hypothetical protein